MKYRYFPMFFAVLAPGANGVAQASERLPWDVRMPIGVGGGYTAMYSGGAVNLAIGAAFVGRELVRGVHPELTLGTDFVFGPDLPLVLPDKDGKVGPYGFPRSTTNVGMGFGLFFGGHSGFAVSAIFQPGAALGSLYGKKQDDSITTVGASLLGRVEIHPWYMSMRRGSDDDEEREPGYGRWLLSAFSFYVVFRQDWVEAPAAPGMTAPQNGPFFGLGIVIDVARVGLLPFFPRETDEKE